MNKYSSNTILSKNFCLFLSIFTLYSCGDLSQQSFDVVVIGGGTGGTTAGIQAARIGSKTLIVESGPWLGGMLTSAGVSATDGNHQMPAGLWGEFRQKIWDYYGGPNSVATGWVSNTHFEPNVGATILKNMVEEESQLQVLFETKIESIVRENRGWSIALSNGETIKATIVIDGTDLGDVAAAVGVDFDLGMDASSLTNESMAPEQSNDIIQDLTYTAILKDYGPGIDKTITRPFNYDSTLFRCSCLSLCPTDSLHSCQTMLNYAKLPNDKYLINWPTNGNDFYANVIPLAPKERQKLFQAAKNRTMNFIYFIQKELNYSNLGLADDEFPTDDLLPLIPYHREGRRIKGKVQLNVNHILAPHIQKQLLYRTGIAVGDYPIDHHHNERLDAPVINFPAVPSFNIPLGSLIPNEIDHFIIADKAISVTNIVNGSSRLQPVVMQIGQAAGIIAGLSVQNNTSPQQISIRAVQEYLLQQNGYLMPYLDVKLDHPHFQSIHRIGATGILRGKGIPYKWANQTWFYPDTIVLEEEFIAGLNHFDPSYEITEASNESLTLQQAVSFIYQFATHLGIKNNLFQNPNHLQNEILKQWKDWGLIGEPTLTSSVNKGTLAVILDKTLNPFTLKEVDFDGTWKEK